MMKKKVNLFETIASYTMGGSLAGAVVNVLLSKAEILAPVNDLEYLLSVGIGALVGCNIGAFRHAYLVQREELKQLEKARLKFEQNVPGSGFKDEKRAVPPPYIDVSKGNKLERSLEEGVMLARVGSKINITKPHVQYDLAGQLKQHRKDRQEAWAKGDFEFDARIDKAYDKEQARQQAKGDWKIRIEASRKNALVQQGYLRCSCDEVFLPEKGFVSPQTGQKYCESSCYEAQEN
jgi:hypothetical protein